MTVQTNIADLVGANPGVLANLVLAKYRVNNSLISSGVAVTGPEVELLMSGGAQVQRLNFVNKVDTTAFNHSSDDFDEKGATGKITAEPYQALRIDANWGWAYTDLVKIITKYDIKSGTLAGAIPMYWSEVGENMAVASMKGALAKATTLTSGVVTDAFNPDAFIDAAATMDDPRAQKTLFVSRKTYAKLQKLQRNDFIAPSAANLNIGRFEGYNLIITEAFGDNKSVVATEGALVFATGVTPGLIPMEIIRDGNAGNGGGGEILRTRMSLVAGHPQGFSYTGPLKPSLVQLATASNWTKVAQDQFIGIRAVNHAA
ncbi:hypothetical protein JQK15_13585 [Sphingobium sp. BHU LFT2]|uniref:hypothetical protein n=1 Tax=Sphingobium sp. BHU LFT2 TaxID=2807634 RepID=UPI001BE60B2F|nr:hypothetical protein [Sphingobium sp. BHU LFT2]MBT2244571.1 hypothetical protein [Sphingobium sp. BHU LFT2]